MYELLAVAKYYGWTLGDVRAMTYHDFRYAVAFMERGSTGESG